LKILTGSDRTTSAQPMAGAWGGDYLFNWPMATCLWSLLPVN